MTSDQELLAAWRAGDRQAGSTLFERHFDAVRRFFRNKVDHQVEDLVQRTFFACVEGRDRFRGESSFRTYLFAIAHNVLRDHLRRHRRTPDELDLECMSIVDLGASPTSLLAARSEERLLLHGLRKIPVASQVILELYYWEHMTGPELGVFLAVPEDTARSRLRRAKQQLEAEIRKLEASASDLQSTISGLDQWAAGLRAQLAQGR
ncbi:MULTISPECIES: sigma-70 family RNA polymerase sigma factor [Nannocystis]|uniref:Sigma-70 family RNA polymerase sigma factor n=2 Tax=Nannocystis TaxID=53 RepID=A0ABS7TRF7_9BACT|nr:MULTISPECIES: sigma-70 family RNA polymerase sigma factor [Nannocystis]MBZ5710770.1 sigma-70 family RNA polymerase sigma factor [Nannocystis pusilla]MCY1059098.1 sigma-70 family RNA polymerase sigma factor [Nannocystis sp. SCPEA4]MDC0672025.1 sigma-70 family RNA polymerase sigma factor [Nannocystis radixulma]